MTNEKPRAYIVGDGAVGLFLAARLSACRNAAILASAKRLAGLDSRQALVKCGDAAPVEVPLLGLSEGPPKHPAEIWLSVKAYDLDAALAALKPHLSGHTPLILLSNGLGIYFQAATALPREIPIVRMLLNFGVSKTSDFSCTLHGEPRVSLSTIPRDAALAGKLGTELEELGFQVQYEKDIATAEWKKALVNLTVNSLATIADRENRFVVDDPHMLSITEHMLTEIRCVARADGFDLSTPSNDEIFASIRLHGSNFNSSLTDIRRGRHSEGQYMLGRFLKLAKDYGIDTPYCRTVKTLYDAVEDTALGPQLN